MSLSPITLSKHLAQQQAVVSTVTHELSLLIGHIAVGGKIISRELSDAALGGELGLTGKTNVQGEAVQKLDKLANDVFVQTLDGQEHRQSRRVRRDGKTLGGGGIYR